MAHFAAFQIGELVIQSKSDCTNRAVLLFSLRTIGQFQGLGGLKLTRGVRELGMVR